MSPHCLPACGGAGGHQQLPIDVLAATSTDQEHAHQPHLRAGEQVATNSWLSTARAFCSSSQCAGPVVMLNAPGGDVEVVGRVSGPARECDGQGEWASERMRCKGTAGGR